MWKMTGIRFRLISVMVLTVTVLLGGFGAIDHADTRSDLEAAMRQQLTAALDRMSDSLPGPLWNFDEDQVSKIISAEMSAPFVLGIVVHDGDKLLRGVVRDADGRLAAAESIALDDDFRQARALQHTEDGESRTIATVTVHATRRMIDQALTSSLYHGLIKIAVLDVFIILALAFMLERIVLVPLRRMTRALQNIAGGDADLTQRLPASHILEFGKVVEYFNTFVDRLGMVMLEIRSGAGNIAGATREIADGNADLSSRTEMGASALQQTAASIAQIAASARDNADSSRLASEMAVDACVSAKDAGAVVAGIVTLMRSIDESSRRITEIISVIDGIAFQTNILALNAAVEAARAGQQGRGFAVVAAEVRSLAQRSADAARQIKTLIDESVARIAQGNARVEQAGATMTGVVDRVGRVSDVISGVTESIGEQTLGIDQIDQAVRQLDDAMQQNAALVEQSAAASAMLQEQTRNLQQQVAVFRLGADADRIDGAARAGRAGDAAEPAGAIPSGRHGHRPDPGGRDSGARRGPSVEAAAASPAAGAGAKPAPGYEASPLEPEFA